ncbi:hypothetical protein IMSAG249_00826 [Lachnospiraceae bacterium]|jgi:hypothetical protein|nr:hypothetical protein [Lachnospiraceae bacterium]GFI69005.1 hypothetical protein IMSAG249_00826 [Lachnospiraceae bacterium]
MLSILVIEEFENYFAGMIPVAEYIAKEHYMLEEKAGEYMAGLVGLSEKFHMPFAPDIAVIKGKIQNYVPDLHEEVRNGRYEKKIKRQYLLDCLSEAKACTDDYFAKTRQLLDESSILLRKIAAVAAAKGLLEKQQTADIDDIILHMKQDAELMPALTSAIGTAGYLNMKCLLERAVSEVLEE